MMGAGRRGRKYIAAVVLAFACGAQAQAVSDTATLYSGIAFSVASLVVLILAGILIRRFGNRRKNDLNDAGLDLMGLRQKNLLTPEEMKMVSAALARRMAEKESRQKQGGTGALSTATLLHDPEVLRLQELAEAKRAAGQQQAAAAQPAEPAPGPVVGGETGQAVDAVGKPAESTREPDDVELPPEVQQLADAGILTPEEIENVKRRLRNRQ